MSPRELGLHGRDLLPQLLFMGMGLGLGATAYGILKPPPLISSFTWTTLWLPALSLMVCTGFVEEMIFRALLQSTARAVLGQWAFVYVALLFAVLQIGFRSPPELGLAFSMGLLFAYVVHWSHSLVGVALAHGLANVTLLLIMPGVAWHYPGRVRAISANIATLGLLVAGIGAGMLVWQWHRPCVPTSCRPGEVIAARYDP
jgi:membrane protease YdiL (CAAX protease family)